MSAGVKPENAVATPQPRSVAMGARGVALTTMEEAWRVCTAISKSGLAPRGLDTPEKIFVAVQTGAEAGLTPMASLRSVVVINGTPSWKGEAALALIRNSRLCISTPRVFVRGEGDAREGVFAVHREGGDPVEVTFSVADAKKAKLWGKSGPWSEYPDSMLTWRAVGRGSKLYFSDVLIGMAIAEEVRDYPAEAHPEPAKPAEPDPLLDEATRKADAAFVEEAIEIDPDTGEVIPPLREPSLFGDAK
jgi:hypothetical protein